MQTYLFIAALFLALLFVLNLEFLLLPDAAVALLGVALLILGAAIAVYGRRWKGPPPSRKKAAPSGKGEGKKTRRPTARLIDVVGAMYAVTGLGILVLQAIGFFFG
jgi:hypothetical protein